MKTISFKAVRLALSLFAFLPAIAAPGVARADEEGQQKEYSDELYDEGCDLVVGAVLKAEVQQGTQILYFRVSPSVSMRGLVKGSHPITVKGPDVGMGSHHHILEIFPGETGVFCLKPKEDQKLYEAVALGEYYYPFGVRLTRPAVPAGDAGALAAAFRELKAALAAPHKRGMMRARALELVKEENPYLRALGWARLSRGDEIEDIQALKAAFSDPRTTPALALFLDDLFHHATGPASGSVPDDRERYQLFRGLLEAYADADRHEAILGPHRGPRSGVDADSGRAAAPALAPTTAPAAPDGSAHWPPPTSRPAVTPSLNPAPPAGRG